MNLYIFEALLPHGFGFASVHADPDPGGISVCADPSGSETLSKIQYTFQIPLNIDNRIPVPGLAWFYVLIMKMSSWISKL